jgi:predicted RNase H-like nuclease (RuvC/YqgF family)
MNEMIVTTVVSTLTAVGGFYYGIKKDKQDLVSKSLNNIALQISIYESIISGLRTEIKLLTEKIEDQQKTICHLESRVEEFLSPKSNL